ncbi:FAD-dependent oxidoreductase, partial [candidate division CSSED10-310 bacterium]
QVTVIELLPQLIPGTDDRVAKMLRRILAKQGLTFHLETTVTGYEKTEAGVTIKARDKKGKDIAVTADKVLVAVGRKPNTAGLDLDKIGITIDQRTGQVPVNERYQTNIDSVYAIGDLIAGPMLAHKAEDEGVAVAEILVGKKGHVRYDIIPGVVYTWPEVATVGQTEAALKTSGRDYKVGLFNFRANGRALCMDAGDGFVKILADQKTDTVLGVHILGPWASDLIAEAVSVMEFGGSAEDIARTMHAHPTLSEALKEAAMAVDNWSIHSAPVRKR